MRWRPTPRRAAPRGQRRQLSALPLPQRRREVEGYLVDLWQLWQSRTGIGWNLTATNWAEAQRMIADGRADVIDMIYRTPSVKPSTSSPRPTPICRWRSTPTSPSAASAA